MVKRLVVWCSIVGALCVLAAVTVASWDELLAVVYPERRLWGEWTGQRLIRTETEKLDRSRHSLWFGNATATFGVNGHFTLRLAVPWSEREADGAKTRRWLTESVGRYELDENRLTLFDRDGQRSYFSVEFDGYHSVLRLSGETESFLLRHLRDMTWSP